MVIRAGEVCSYARPCPLLGTRNKPENMGTFTMFRPTTDTGNEVNIPRFPPQVSPGQFERRHHFGATARSRF